MSSQRNKKTKSERSQREKEKKKRKKENPPEISLIATWSSTARGRWRNRSRTIPVEKAMHGRWNALEGCPLCCRNFAAVAMDRYLDSRSRIKPPRAEFNALHVGYFAVPPCTTVKVHTGAWQRALNTHTHTHTHTNTYARLFADSTHEHRRVARVRFTSRATEGKHFSLVALQREYAT